MAKLIMLSGLPASGKTTKAKEIMAAGNTVRVNKDLIRTMLHFDRFTSRNEGFTRDAEKGIAINFLTASVNVVVDDTNLGKQHLDYWQNVAAETGSKFQHINMNTPWFVCVARDNEREKPVGPMVIKNMALQYGLVIPPKAGYVLCDLDGTLADISHRLHWVKREKPDWKAFFEYIPEDQIRTDTLEILLEYIKQGCDIIFVSARPEEHKQATVEWLAKNDIFFGFTLLMRGGHDNRKDEEVKRDLLLKYFPDKSVITAVIDDRPRVIRMWKEEGLNVIDVGKGVEF